MINFIKARKKEAFTMLISILLLGASYFVKNETISIIIIGIAYIVSGWKVIVKAVRNILNGQLFDENFLMTVATFGAIAIGEYSEAVFVMIFYNAGELFQKSAVEKSRESIMSLMDLCPETVNLLKDGALVEADPYDAEIGDIMVVKAGEKIALDGIVESGSSFLNTVALTGESVPREVKIGDPVMSGCINENGVLNIRVTKRAEDSTVSKILELVENSVERKSKYENFISKFAKYYTPCVVLGAILVAILPPLLWNADWSAQIRSAMVFLMISCPCALVISVPLTFFGGIGRASKMGILIKGASSLENLSKVKTVAFDKTGTLTKGVFSVTDIVSEYSNEEILSCAAYAETFSEHPIAKSLKKAYGKEIDISQITDAQEKAGMGIIATVKGEKISVGNKKLMALVGAQIKDQPKEYGSVVFVAKEDRYLGAIVISDIMKEESFEAVTSLNKKGIRTVMLSGDKASACEYVANKLEINEYHSELMPDEKLKIVNDLVEDGERKGLVCFVGDGINDAPVLAAADISVAMGAFGSDAAIEASDIVLVDDNPLQITNAIELSKKVMVIARQNIVFSLAVKFAILLLGLFGIAGIWEAIFSDVGVSVIAILNAIRTLKINNK